jgi:hypothetical protein
VTQIFQDLTIQIGEGPVHSITGTGQPLLAFLAAVSGLGAADENGKSPLIIEIGTGGFGITFRAGARLRLGGMFAIFFLAGEQDAHPTPAKVFDTRTENVRYGDRSLLDKIADIDARHLYKNTVIAGVHKRDIFDLMTAKGAVAGDTLEVWQATRSDTFSVQSGSTFSELLDWVNNSDSLNPDGYASAIRLDHDPVLGALRLTSLTHTPIDLYGPPRLIAAIFGSLPE